MTSETGTDADRVSVPVLAAVGTQVLWSAGNNLAAGIDFPGLQLAGWRLGAAAVVYAIGLRLLGRRLSLEDLRASAVGGVTFGLNLGLAYLALKETSIANMTTMAAMQPVLVAFVAVRMFGERINRRQAALIVVAIIGVVITVWGSSGAEGGLNARGDILAGVSVVFWAWYFIASKRARERVAPAEYQTAVLLISTATVIPLILMAGGDVEAPSWRVLGGIALLVAIPGTGHLIMNWAHPYVPVTVSSTITLLLPPFSIVGAYLFLDQDLTPMQTAGIAIVLATLLLFLTWANPTFRARGNSTATRDEQA